MSGISVIYLVWPPAGVETLDRFAASYREHPAGLDHRLLLLLKGVEAGPLADRCRALTSEFDAQTISRAPVGQDLDDYRAAAQRVNDTVLCFLNSYSEILVDGWLKSLSAGLERPGVGLVGATASNESALSAAPRPLRPLLRSRYQPFPNPHIRTNGFMLRRELMLSLDWRPSRRKRAALELESGKQGITRQIEDRGLRTAVIGRDGCYERERWHESRTFRCGCQENLLIADNRTRQYADAGSARRAQLAQMAWGEQPPVSLPPASRPQV